MIKVIKIICKFYIQILMPRLINELSLFDLNTTLI